MHIKMAGKEAAITTNFQRNP